MSDLPFDIDDILNEIDKRKSEIEQEIGAVSVNTKDTKSSEPEKAAEAKIVETAEPAPVAAKPAPVAPEAEQAEPEPTSVAPEPEEDKTAPESVNENEEAHFNEHEISASYFDDVDKIFAEKENTGDHAEEAGAKDEGVNIFDFVEGASASNDTAKMRSTRKSKSDKKKKKSKKGKIFLSIIIILVIAIAGTGAFGAYYVNKILSDITINNNNNEEANPKTEEWTGMDKLVVKFDDIYEDSNVYSYRDMVKTWYYNGEPASSTNILNVLLIGEDTRGDEIKDKGSLADSVIIASVNTETGELILSSILRDTYAYYELVPGDESTGTYGKINECMSKGGLSAYINAVERLFKINIDNYVLVNFANFKKIIDTLGGVTIDMTAAEIREINNHPGTYGNVYIDGDAGEKLLNGEQALAYCRIRHLDGDQFRADRQKTVLLDVFSQLKSASMIKLTSVVTNLLPYVKTGFTKSEILSLGQYAISKGWLGYNIVTHTVPKNDTRADGTPITTCVGGQGSSFYNVWCWKVDFPLATQVLQEKIYGKTNVVLADYRPSFSNLSAY